MNPKQREYILKSYGTKSTKEIAQELELDPKEVQREIRKIHADSVTRAVQKEEKNKGVIRAECIVPTPKVGRNEKILLAGAILLAGFLILIRLGDNYLWEDEAHTVLISRTIIKCGIPKATDGLNSFSFGAHGKNTDVTEDGTLIYPPWLQYYLIAPLAWLPAEGTEWLFRLPFALFGICTIPLVFFLARRFFGIQTAVLAAYILVLSVSFLLHVRQCRYYALVMFLSTWMILGYDKALKGEKGALSHLFLSQFFLFHTNQMIWLGFGMGFAAHFLLMCFSWKKLKLFFFLGICSLVGHLPWIWMFGRKSTGSMARASVYFSNIRYAVLGINDQLLPFAYIALFVLIWVLSRWREKKLFFWHNGVSYLANRVSLVGMLTISNVLCVSFAPVYFLRYLTGIIPLLVCLKAFMSAKIIEWRKFLGVCIFILVVF